MDGKNKFMLILRDWPEFVFKDHGIDISKAEDLLKQYSQIEPDEKIKSHCESYGRVIWDFALEESCLHTGEHYKGQRGAFPITICKMN